MSEFRDLSRLPREQSYWDDLESRILAELGPRVREGANGGSSWWAPLAARAWTLGGLALAAGIAALFLMPPRSSNEPDASSGLLQLPKNDPVLVAFVSAPAPPSIASLVIPSSRSDE